MKRNRFHISGVVLLVMLALATILMAPVAAFSHDLTTSGDTVAMASDSGCHGDAADHQDDCCETTACACACHAPLATGIMLPLPVAVPLAFAAFVEQQLPQVDLPIFVPPQNLS